MTNSSPHVLSLIVSLLAAPLALGCGASGDDDATDQGGLNTGGGDSLAGVGGAGQVDPGVGGGVATGGVGTGGGTDTGAGGVAVAGAGGSIAGTGGMGDPEEPPDPDKAPATLLGDVVISTPSQSFRELLGVEFSTSVVDAEIRYTTDGSVPTESSELYAGPLMLTETTQLRAQTFVSGSALGAMSTALYIARTFDLDSSLPIMLVEGYSQGKPTDKDVYFDVAVMTFEPVNGVARMTELPDLAVRGGYHIRGQSSASFEQAPYKIEFWDNENKDDDYPLLGMPAESDWALIPPYYDRTLIRNPFTYELGKEMGLEAPRTAFAEVYLNQDGGPMTEEDYQGVYWVSELIKNQKDRLNLQQLKPDDVDESVISGGYIFKFDQAAAEEPILECVGANPLPGFSFGGGGGGQMTGGTCWVDLEVVDPSEPNEQQMAWLGSYLQQFHDIVHLEPLGDYGQFIDVASFVDYLILNELTYNVDAFVRSAYYHKDRDGLLKAGPLWDYNFALGGVGAQIADAIPQADEEPSTGWRHIPGRNVNSWMTKLMTDPAFLQNVKTRYAELRQGLFSDAALAVRIDELTARVVGASAHDEARWPPADVIPATGFTAGPTAPTWEGQVQVMRDFVVARLAWMDTQLLQ